MKSLWIYSLRTVVLAGVYFCRAAAEDQPVVHDPAIHTGGGLKRELIAGISEADFLRWGDKPKTARIILIAAFTETNSWMNFNGYSHGGATYTIPTGWTVEVTLINPSPSPHSAIVVEREMVRKVQLGEPAFPGASTPQPVVGMSTNRATFTFTAGEPGEYAIACGIPTHAIAGHWIALTVNSETKVPTFKPGDVPAKEAKER